MQADAPQPQVRSYSNLTCTCHFGFFWCAHTHVCGSSLEQVWTGWLLMLTISSQPLQRRVGKAHEAALIIQTKAHQMLQALAPAVCMHSMGFTSPAGCAANGKQEQSHQLRVGGSTYWRRTSVEPEAFSDLLVKPIQRPRNMYLSKDLLHHPCRRPSCKDLGNLCGFPTFGSTLQFTTKNESFHLLDMPKCSVIRWKYL